MPAKTGFRFARRLCKAHVRSRCSWATWRRWSATCRCCSTIRNARRSISGRRSGVAFERSPYQTRPACRRTGQARRGSRRAPRDPVRRLLWRFLSEYADALVASGGLEKVAGNRRGARQSRSQRGTLVSSRSCFASRARSCFGRGCRTLRKKPRDVSSNRSTWSRQQETIAWQLRAATSLAQALSRENRTERRLATHWRLSMRASARALRRRI